MRLQYEGTLSSSVIMLTTFGCSFSLTFWPFYSEKPAGDLIVGNVQKRYKKWDSVCKMLKEWYNIICVISRICGGKTAGNSGFFLRFGFRRKNAGWQGTGSEQGKEH